MYTDAREYNCNGTEGEREGRNRERDGKGAGRNARTEAEPEEVKRLKAYS